MPLPESNPASLLVQPLYRLSYQGSLEPDQDAMTAYGELRPVSRLLWEIY
jgi:hypothetical protein